MEAHGGAVEASSPGDGKGSTFTVRLPIRAVRIGEGEDGLIASDTDKDKAEEAVPDVDRRSWVSLDGLRVLVVDDEADAAEYWGSC